MLNLTQKPYLLTTKQAESIQQLVSEMTTEEKIGQLFISMSNIAVHRWEVG